MGTCKVEGLEGRFLIKNTRRIQGSTFYWVQLHNGYYDDELGDRRYDSNLIKFEWFCENQVSEVRN